VQQVIRVVHFVHRLPPEYSGASRQAIELIPHIGKDEGIENHLVGYAWHPDAVEYPTGIPCVAVGLRRGWLGKVAQYSALFAALWRAHARVVHIHGYHRPVLLFGWLLGKRLLLKTTLFGIDDVGSIRAKTPLDRYLVRKVACTVSLTKRLSDVNRQWGPEARITNGVDPTRFRADADPVAARHVTGLPPECTVFLYSGGDSARKGFLKLPDLWGRIRTRLRPFSPHLVVLGCFRASDSLPWLQERVHGKDVTVVDRLVADMPVWLAASDVFLCLSTEEGLPNSVLEAVCMNRFVMARRIPDTYDDVLFESNSLLVDELDAQAIERLGERLAAGRHRDIDNRGVRERVDIRRAASRYAVLYRELVA
jgi:glycosyltransferase involved in cell wall biosynthesis